MDKEKNQPKKEHVCPHCGEKQTVVIEVLEIIVRNEINIYTAEITVGDHERSEHIEWQCPNCGEELTDAFVEELKIWGG